MEHWNRRESIRIVTMPVTVILGWPKSLFGFSAGYYEKTQMNFLANPICDKGEILFQLQVSISFFFFFRKLFIYIIIFLWLHWFFVAASGFSSWLQPAGAILCCSAWISHCCSGAEKVLKWFLLLKSPDSRPTGSRCTGFSSSSMQGQFFWLVGPRACCCCFSRVRLCAIP